MSHHWPWLIKEGEDMKAIGFEVLQSACSSCSCWSEGDPACNCWFGWSFHTPFSPSKLWIVQGSLIRTCTKYMSASCSTWDDSQRTLSSYDVEPTNRARRLQAAAASLPSSTCRFCCKNAVERQSAIEENWLQHTLTRTGVVNFELGGWKGSANSFVLESKKLMMNLSASLLISIGPFNTFCDRSCRAWHMASSVAVSTLMRRSSAAMKRSQQRCAAQLGCVRHFARQLRRAAPGVAQSSPLCSYLSLTLCWRR